MQEEVYLRQQCSSVVIKVFIVKIWENVGFGDEGQGGGGGCIFNILVFQHLYRDILLTEGKKCDCFRKIGIIS